MMKRGAGFAICLTVAFIGSIAYDRPADARRFRHWQHEDSYAAGGEYIYGGALSPLSYIYPSANWGPFFHRVRHYGPLAGPLPYATVHIY